MFIHVVYKDAPELSQTIRKLSTAGDEEESIEKTLLVNPNCPVRIMLEYIRKKCKLGKFTNFDLCDESGALKQLFSLPTFAYATDLFEHKKQYYIIVKKQESDKRVSVIPQVNRDNRLYTELKEKVKRFILTGPSPADAATPKTTPPGKITPTSKSSTPPGKVTPPKKK